MRTEPSTYVLLSTSFDDDPFLMAVAKQHPDVVFRQASLLAHPDYPKNVGSQNALINQGHYVNGVAAGLCTKSTSSASLPAFRSAASCSTSTCSSRAAAGPTLAATVQVIFT